MADNEKLSRHALYFASRKPSGSVERSLVHSRIWGDRFLLVALSEGDETGEHALFFRPLRVAFFFLRFLGARYLFLHSLGRGRWDEACFAFC